MEITAIKKGRMPAVRKWSILLTLFFIAGCASSLSLQKVIMGTFYQKYVSPEASASYQFSDHTFKIQSSLNLNVEKHAGGVYRIAGDILILDYESLEDTDPSVYSFVTQNPISGSFNFNSTSRDSTGGSVQFQILDKKK